MSTTVTGGRREAGRETIAASQTTRDGCLTPRAARDKSSFFEFDTPHAPRMTSSTHKTSATPIGQNKSARNLESVLKMKLQNRWITYLVSHVLFVECWESIPRHASKRLSWELRDSSGQSPTSDDAIKRFIDGASLTSSGRRAGEVKLASIAGSSEFSPKADGMLVYGHPMGPGGTLKVSAASLKAAASQRWGGGAMGVQHSKDSSDRTSIKTLDGHALRARTVVVGQFNFTVRSKK